MTLYCARTECSAWRSASLHQCGGPVAVVVESPPGGVPSFGRELVPAVMLEQHDWPAIGSVGGEVVLEPGQAADRAFRGVTREAVRLDQMESTPVPRVTVGRYVVIGHWHWRLEKYRRAVIELDIIPQFSPIPIDLRRWAVLIQVVVAKTGINRKMDTVGTDTLLVALAELAKL